MGSSSGVMKAIGYAFGGAVSASLLVLLLGLCVFGSQITHWAEWQGRIVGTAGTIGGAAGAAVGLFVALRAQRGGAVR
jgi:hypothetical protein